MARRFYVYILSNRNRRLYIGVTNDIVTRVNQHRSGIGSKFASRYGMVHLVYVEVANCVRDAIAREKQLKGWSRSKKLGLIERDNPQWADLARDWFSCDA